MVKTSAYDIGMLEHNVPRERVWRLKTVFKSLGTPTKFQESYIDSNVNFLNNGLSMY